MSKVSQNSLSEKAIGQSRTLVHGYNRTLQLRIGKLHGQNFLKQFQSINLFIEMRGKMGYLLSNPHFEYGM